MRKRYLAALVVIIITLLAAACAPAAAFKSEADEKLYKSIEESNIKMAIESVTEGANIDKLKRGRLISINMVEFAARSGCRDIASWLIGNGADVNYKTSIMGETLLMNMASGGEYELCKLLLEKGADINAKDRLSDTALEYAFKADGNIPEDEINELITLFLENGAQIRRETLAAALNGYSGAGSGDGRYGLVRRVTQYLVENGIETKLSPALEAAVLGYGDYVVSAINSSSSEIRDGEGLLFYTAAFGNSATLSALEEAGLDTGAVDGNGNTLLMTASCYGNTEVVKYLLEKNPDFYAKNRFGESALDIALKRGNDDLFALLEEMMPALEAGAFVGKCDCCCRCG